MNGSNTNKLTRQQALDASRVVPKDQDFVWDGVDEDERPATETELRDALIADLRKRGRPQGSDKTQIALRVDNVTLAAFKATGKGWQSRMNEALKDWLASHPAA